MKNRKKGKPEADSQKVERPAQIQRLGQGQDPAWRFLSPSLVWLFSKSGHLSPWIDSGQESKRDPSGTWGHYGSVSAPSWTRLLGPRADSNTKSVVTKYCSNHLKEPRGVHMGREFTGLDCLSVLSLFILSILPPFPGFHHRVGFSFICQPF